MTVGIGKLAVGFLGKYSHLLWMGTAMHLRNKSNKDSTRSPKRLEAISRDVCLWCAKGKRQDADPEGLETTTAGHSSKGMNVLSL